MKDYYASDVVVRTPAGVGHGEPGMTQATMETLIEFPDRVLLGEDVIWSGTPEDGMLSSHRILSKATHSGGAFAEATGREVVYRALADCYAKDNQISDEWLVRDNGAALRQLGILPEDWARARVAEGRAGAPLTPANDPEGPYLGRGNDNEWSARYAGFLSRMMEAEFSVIPAEYDRACELHYAGGVDGNGHAAADRFWLSLRAAFPSADFRIEHQIGREDPMMAPRAAVRWSLFGKHDGWGRIRAADGRRGLCAGHQSRRVRPLGPAPRMGALR